MGDAPGPLVDAATRVRLARLVRELHPDLDALQERARLQEALDVR